MAVPTAKPRAAAPLRARLGREEARGLGVKDLHLGEDLVREGEGGREGGHEKLEPAERGEPISPQGIAPA